MGNTAHLIWIAYGALTGFAISFIFGDLLILPADLYYFIYFSIISVFFTLYVKSTGLCLRRWFSRRLGWGVFLGLAFGAAMAQNVLSRPPTEQYGGWYLAWLIFWRGVIYGATDGLLLSVFPWTVTWRALQAERKPLRNKLGISLLAWIFILVMSTAYHAGYDDFRSSKILQANLGNTLISAPLLITSNPLSAPITHAAMHIAAVVHVPRTDLFLPPHRKVR